MSARAVRKSGPGFPANSRRPEGHVAVKLARQLAPDVIEVRRRHVARARQVDAISVSIRPGPDDIATTRSARTIAFGVVGEHARDRDALLHAAPAIGRRDERNGRLAEAGAAM